jgi:hypothetical protein
VRENTSSRNVGGVGANMRNVSREEHSKKAKLSISVTLLPIVTEVRDEHPWNA